MKRSLFLLLFASTAHAETLTFQGAIQLSLGKNLDVEVAKEGVAGAEAHTSSIESKRWATLGLNMAGNLWREPYALDFGGQQFVLHERTTSATAVMVSQPLTGLAYLSELIGAAQHDARAAHDEYDRVKLETAYHTAEAYLRVLEARARADVAHRSVVDLVSELDRAKQLRAADTYTDIDVLRFQSAKSGADITALKADTTAEQALAGLVVQLGLHDGAHVDLADDLPQTAPPLAMTLEQALSRAVSARPELAAAREKIAAANHNRRAAYAHYFPDVRAVGVWQHLTGVQPFQPEDEEYVGVQVQWSLWDWGATHHGIAEAEHSEQRAILSAAALGDQVKLDVRRKWLDAKAAFDSLTVSQAQVAAAEEAYRLQKVRFENAAATTTDVLDSETDVARARLVFVVARYDYYLSLVALARSVGDLPHS